MTHLIKDTFYKEKLYQVSLSSFSFAQEQAGKQKEAKQPISEDVLKKALTTYGKTAEGQHYAYLSFMANNLDLTSLHGIEKFKHLQHIDVSNNSIKSLKPLNGLKYIITLKASNNRLTKLLDLKHIPLQIMDVDCSNNEIEVIPDLSCHRFLRYLNLSYNKIRQIEGVQKNKYLQVLKLANNHIDHIENLDGMNLTELDLFGNEITILDGLTQLPKLRKLELSQNQIKSLNGIVDLISVRELRMANNKISRIKELSFLENLVFLSVLDLCYNPIQNRRYYRWQVLYKLPGLRNLDGVQVPPEDIVKAENLYGMDLEDRKRIFKEVLPDEEFIDRRIHISELIEPETEDENENQEFIDQYDKTGKMMQKQTKSIGSQKSISEMYHSNKSLQEREYQ
ncbi:unnamed protein product (macronuclear) [Paramecium tetraurelia]|uniref:U2A'/phosphoprotein 32 family A C-terminal domain-containing protein n=1 Tax=Paramecium tetraurelia TaxID=5888 RepID=A0C636_PARTE|nr:uncharacterized protein GSPATT00035382001 [Paramecium tetraurelia]CAK66253.1 unnamed protein product [Paramecium tetraurelia]|eukprot:XP_001433650.1 hypothetical protein (macronuclear) [Paramecium tetraurelia strain d4-2]